MAKKSMTTKGETGRSAADYLKMPYTQTVVRDEDGSFHAEIAEFPGCFADGQTAAEALALLEEVAESWIGAMTRDGQPIPPPLEANEYSGKLVLRLPKSTHKKAAQIAEREGVSLNAFISNCVAEGVGARRHVSAPRTLNHVQILANVVSTHYEIGSGRPRMPLGHGLVLSPGNTSVITYIKNWNQDA